MRPEQLNLGALPTSDPLEDLLTTLEVRVEAFAVCKVREGAALLVEPKDAVVVHFILSGSGEIQLAGSRRFPFGPRSLVIVPAHQRKSMTGVDGPAEEVIANEACQQLSGGLLVFEAGQGLEDIVTVCGVIGATYAGGFGLFDDLAEPLVEDITAVRGVDAAFDLMRAEAEAPGLGSRALTQALMKQCLVLLLRERLARFAEGDPLLTRLRDPRLMRAVSVILAQPADAHSVQSLAEHAGMSRSVFTERFLAAFGQTPFQFVQRVRLRQAAYLLRTSDVPVKAISKATGFESRSHFSRAFKAIYGADPTHYRRPEPPEAA